MRKGARKALQITALVLTSVLVLVLAYAYQRARFIQRTNALFDPKEKAFKGLFLPWPIGSPTLVGGFDSKTDSRIRASLGYESGTVSTNGMTLIIHDSTGTFLVRAN